MNKKGAPLKLVGRERLPAKGRSSPGKEAGTQGAPQSEVVSDWEDVGGRLDTSNDSPDSDSPARGT